MVHRPTSELRRADGERLRIEHERAEVESGRAASEAERARREAAMGRLGRMALRVPDRQALLDEAVAIVTETLGIADCAILELVEGGDRVRLAAATGAAIDPDADPEELATEDRLLTGWVLAGEEPVTVWEWASERRFDAPGLRDRGIRSTAAAAIRGRTGAFGIIGVHAADLGVFSADDAQWLQSMADLLASALDRDESEARMRHQSLHDASRACRTGRCCSTASSTRFARAQRARRSSRSCSSTSTGSRRSTTRSATRRATSCSSRSARACARHPRPGDTVARLGGDEFVVLCEDESRGRGRRRRRAHRRRLRSRRPRRDRRRDLRLGEHRHRDRDAGRDERRDAAPRGRRRDVPGQGARPRPLRAVRRGDAPARRSRACGTESDLRRAVERERAPRRTTSRSSTSPSGALLGVEALVRWDHPGSGIVGPAEFIGLAEETGLIVPLGALGARARPAAQVARWRERCPHAADLGVTVNVSGRQLARPEFLDEVAARARPLRPRPARLGLEITESVADGATSTSPRSTLERAAARSACASRIDDFGTGYSSLALPASGLPVDVLKVDRSFVDGLGAEDEDTAIVAAIVDTRQQPRPRARSPRASRPRRSSTRCASSAATARRATSSPRRCAPTSFEGLLAAGAVAMLLEPAA